LKEISFYFDYLSPYSYLAWCWIRTKREFFTKQNYLINLKPITMVPVIKAHETKGPAEIPSKREFLLRDTLRKAAQNDFLINPPHKLPFFTTDLLRLTLAQGDYDQRWQLTDLFFKACWEKALDVEEPDILNQFLASHQVDYQSLWTRSAEREIKVELKKNVKEAKERSLFGVPTFYFEEEKELFWGFEALNDLSLFCEQKDSLDRKKYQEFLACFTE
jgi:2-hydroxychromene-2-carboxylate isomerase